MFGKSARDQVEPIGRIGRATVGLMGSPQRNIVPVEAIEHRRFGRPGQLCKLLDGEPFDDVFLVVQKKLEKFFYWVYGAASSSNQRFSMRSNS
jgi:hypothetical protein